MSMVNENTTGISYGKKSKVFWILSIAILVISFVSFLPIANTGLFVKMPSFEEAQFGADIMSTSKKISIVNLMFLVLSVVFSCLSIHYSVKTKDIDLIMISSVSVVFVLTVALIFCPCGVITSSGGIAGVQSSHAAAIIDLLH